MGASALSKWYPCIYCTEDLHCKKYEEPCSESWCVLGPCTAETPSHGDTLRRMDDEELAYFLGCIIHEWCCGEYVIRWNGKTAYVFDWLDWLKEGEDEEDGKS